MPPQTWSWWCLWACHPASLTLPSPTTVSRRKILLAFLSPCWLVFPSCCFQVSLSFGAWAAIFLRKALSVWEFTELFEGVDYCFLPNLGFLLSPLFLWICFLTLSSLLLGSPWGAFWCLLVHSKALLIFLPYSSSLVFGSQGQYRSAGEGALALSRLLPTYCWASPQSPVFFHL